MNNNRAQLLQGNWLSQNNFITRFCNLPEHKMSHNMGSFLCKCSGLRSTLPNWGQQKSSGGAAAPVLLLTFKGQSQMSGGGLRHILVKSMQCKFGFHYTLISFCQFSARYHCTVSGAMPWVTTSATPARLRRTPEALISLSPSNQSWSRTLL